MSSPPLPDRPLHSASLQDELDRWMADDSPFTFSWSPSSPLSATDALPTANLLRVPTLPAPAIACSEPDLRYRTRFPSKHASNLVNEVGPLAAATRPMQPQRSARRPSQQRDESSASSPAACYDLTPLWMSVPTSASSSLLSAAPLNHPTDPSPPQPYHHQPPLPLNPNSIPPLPTPHEQQHQHHSIDPSLSHAALPIGAIAQQRHRQRAHAAQRQRRKRSRKRARAQKAKDEAADQQEHKEDEKSEEEEEEVRDEASDDRYGYQPFLAHYAAQGRASGAAMHAGYSSHYPVGVPVPVAVAVVASPLPPGVLDDAAVGASGSGGHKRPRGALLIGGSASTSTSSSHSPTQPSSPSGSPASTSSSSTASSDASATSAASAPSSASASVASATSSRVRSPSRPRGRNAESIVRSGRVQAGWQHVAMVSDFPFPTPAVFIYRHPLECNSVQFESYGYEWCERCGRPFSSSSNAEAHHEARKHNNRNPLFVRYDADSGVWKWFHRRRRTAQRRRPSKKRK